MAIQRNKLTGKLAFNVLFSSLVYFGISVLTGIVLSWIAQCNIPASTKLLKASKFSSKLVSSNFAFYFKLVRLQISFSLVVNENVSLVISRQLLTDISNHLITLSPNISKAVAHFTLERIQPRVVSFEEQVAAIRQHLAQIYENEQMWREAAGVLVGIPLETGQKQYSIDYKLDTYLKIARLYLEDDNPVDAEAYINRASLLQAETQNEQLQVMHKACYARVLDYRRKFIEAAQRYNELSYRPAVAEQERMTALKNALICTLLASAGCFFITYLLIYKRQRSIRFRTR